MPILSAAGVILAKKGWRQRLATHIAALSQRTNTVNPTMPQQGMDRQAYLHAKFGPAASAVYAHIKAGSESGIDFNFMDEKDPDTALFWV